jgi:hypothetical protein
MNSCSIENSWIICMKRGSGSRQTKPESGRCTILSPIRAPIAIIPIPLPGFLEVVSTAIENTVLNGYFSKILGLIAISACNLAGFCWSLFLAHISGCFLTEPVCKYHWLSIIAITSEKLGFWGVFAWLGIFLVCRSVRVQIFSKMVSGFFSPARIFSGFSVTPPKICKWFTPATREGSLPQGQPVSNR